VSAAVGAAVVVAGAAADAAGCGAGDAGAGAATDEGGGVAGAFTDFGAQAIASAPAATAASTNDLIP
jgi:hypothetical protein